MDPMKEALSRRKLKGLAITISVEPQNAPAAEAEEEERASDMAPELKAEAPELEAEADEEQGAYLDDVPTEATDNTRTLGGKVMAAMHAARMKKKDGAK